MNSQLCSKRLDPGAWGSDDTIIFTPSNLFSGLFRVSARGGTPKPLTVADRKRGEYSHRWAQILPGGKAVLITIWTGTSIDTAWIDVHLALVKDTPEPRAVQPPGLGAVVELPEVEGLHHRYERRAA